MEYKFVTLYNVDEEMEALAKDGWKLHTFFLRKDMHPQAVFERTRMGAPAVMDRVIGSVPLNVFSDPRFED